MSNQQVFSVISSKKSNRKFQKSLLFSINSTSSRFNSSSFSGFSSPLLSAFSSMVATAQLPSLHLPPAFPQQR
jgi:hypothetical protein